jgi:hypothetical protein
MMGLYVPVYDHEPVLLLFFFNDEDCMAELGILRSASGLNASSFIV